MPMLRSKFITTAASERTTVRERGDLLLVESPTAEEALDRLSSLLGPDVEIVAAGKVARGGVGGFFAREMVQLSARAPSRPAPPAPAAPAAPAAEIPAPLRTLLSERMAEPAAPAWLSPPEPSFGETLRRQLGTEPPPPPSPTAAAESWVPEASPLAAAGLPFSVPPSLPSRLDVLDASWGFAVEDDAQANVGPAAPDPAGAPAGFAPVDPAAATPTVEPRVVLAPLSDTPP